ncbi:hypothetical protein [Shimia marina]|uniref:hypothetical protein n=1 Tax=Shimia marina TaxID=321267 RepID=UPI0008F1D62A|nr:hypothetical protein [Shimia marina]SFD61822.1 hypothetical protein SAMN04488037_101719 [Shimia marina]
MLRLVMGLVALAALVDGTTTTKNVTDETLDLGDFVLGHNIVVARDIQKGVLSREADTDAFIASMKNAIDARMGASRYDGTRLVHFGVNINGYVLAQKGVPIVLQPRSGLIISVTAWDDRAGGKFNEEAKEIFVLETFTGGSLIASSGFSMTAQEQMDNLTYNAARQIEKWMHENAACLVDDVPADVLAACWQDNRNEEMRQKLAEQQK